MVFAQTTRWFTFHQVRNGQHQKSSQEQPCLPKMKMDSSTMASPNSCCKKSHVSSIGSLMIISQVTRSRFNRSKPQQRLILGLSIADLLASLFWVFNSFFVPPESGLLWAQAILPRAIFRDLQFNYSLTRSFVSELITAHVSIGGEMVAFITNFIWYSHCCLGVRFV